MKKILAMILILSLVLVMGCAREATVTSGNVKTPTTNSPTVAQTPAADTVGTEAAVSEVEADLDGLEDLDEDYLSEELDTLDSELDFEI